MNEVDIEHRITEVEQRARSNTHRLEKLEPIVYIVMCKER